MNGTLNFFGRDFAFGTKNTSAYYIHRRNLIIIDCGTNTFSTIISAFDFKSFDEIIILVTHLHPDHSGGLAHLIMYLGYVFHFDKHNIKIISGCKNLELLLDIMGVEKRLYSIASCYFATPIPTKHVPQIDSYGFLLNINQQKLIYTGDTSSLDSFINYLPADELYVDVSKSSSKYHLQIDNIINTLKDISLNGCKVFLMHIDDIDYISQAIGELPNICVVNV